MFKEFLNETRGTEISKLFSEIDKKTDANLIDYHGTFDGFVALINYKGNAYEVKVKPAKNSEEFPHKTKKKKD
jgi:hypothetical protein